MDKDESKASAGSDIRPMRNNTKRTLAVGKIQWAPKGRPGDIQEIDMRPGGMGEILERRRELIDPAKEPKVRPAGSPASGYRCPWCGEEFDDSDDAKKHIVTEHRAAVLKLMDAQEVKQERDRSTGAA